MRIYRYFVIKLRIVCPILTILFLIYLGQLYAVVSLHLQGPGEIDIDFLPFKPISCKYGRKP